MPLNLFIILFESRNSWKCLVVKSTAWTIYILAYNNMEFLFVSFVKTIIQQRKQTISTIRVYYNVMKPSNKRFPSDIISLVQKVEHNKIMNRKWNHTVLDIHFVTIWCICMLSIAQMYRMYKYVVTLCTMNANNFVYVG